MIPLPAELRPARGLLHLILLRGPRRGVAGRPRSPAPGHAPGWKKSSEVGGRQIGGGGWGRGGGRGGGRGRFWRSGPMSVTPAMGIRYTDPKSPSPKPPLSAGWATTGKLPADPFPTKPIKPQTCDQWAPRRFGKTHGHHHRIQQFNVNALGSHAPSFQTTSTLARMRTQRQHICTTRVPIHVFLKI